ncbi:MAG: hypothetical protein IJA15_08075, partial [Clostridia bacterium]|nr:hypothetical protein [Clostridia bacterium]
SLSSIAKMPLEDILYDLLDTVDGSGNSISSEYGSFLKFLNGATLADLIVPTEEGGYSFNTLAVLGVLSNVKVGYILGLTDEDGNGIWEKDGEPASDMLQVIAGMDIGTLLSDDAILVKIQSLFGDVDLAYVFEAVGLSTEDSVILQVLGGLNVGKLLAGQGEEFDGALFLSALKDSLKEELGETTLGELFNLEKTNNPLVDGLFDLCVADLILDEYSAESIDEIVEAFRNALGNVSLGDILGYEKDAETGAWICDNEYLTLVLDFSFNNIFDLALSFVEGDVAPEEIFRDLFPTLTVGDIFCMALGFEYNEVTNEYYKEGVSERPLSDSWSNLLNLKIADVLETVLNEDSPGDTYPEIMDIRVGDLLQLVLIVLDMDYSEFEDDGDLFVWDGNTESGTTELLNTSVLLIVQDLLNGGEKLLTKEIDVYVSIVADLTTFALRLTDNSSSDKEKLINDLEKIACDMLRGGLKEQPTLDGRVLVATLIEDVKELLNNNSVWVKLDAVIAKLDPVTKAIFTDILNWDAVTGDFINRDVVAKALDEIKA